MLKELISKILRRPPKKGHLRENIQYTRPVYYDRHKGRDFIVLATGATLNEYGDRIKAFIKEKNLVTLGVNNITPFMTPDYQGIVNRFRVRQFGKTINPEKTTALMSINFNDKYIEKYCDAPYELIVLKDIEDPRDARIDEEGVIYHKGGTATVLAMVAYAMGADNVYVVGADGYINKDSTYKDIHYVPTGYKEYLTDEQVDQKTRHWFEDVQTQAFQAIADWAVANGRKPLKILTPTQYVGQYSAEELSN